MLCLFAQYIAALFISLFLLCIKCKILCIKCKRYGKIVGEADLVSSALLLHPQCTSNCGFIWYGALQVSLCAPFCVCRNNKILHEH